MARIAVLCLVVLCGCVLNAASASEHDFDFLTGSWHVHHHYLKIADERREWLDYDGSCVHRGLTDDWANTDEYLLNKRGKPTGSWISDAVRSQRLVSKGSNSVRRLTSESPATPTIQNMPPEEAPQNITP